MVVAAGALLAACAPPPPPPPPPPQGPDLIVTDITWPSFNVGDRVPFRATITNIGDTPTPPDTIVDVLFTVDADTLNGRDVGWSDNIRTPLAPGETRTQMVNGGPDGSDGLWTSTPGNHNVRAWVNSGNLPTRPPIAESNATNNLYLRSFTLRVPVTDQIVFVAPGGGIWSMHSDATNVHQLSADGFQPEVSRDGGQIAFIRGVPNAPFVTHVWVMNADGSNPHEVYVRPLPVVGCGLCPPPGPASVRDTSPSWSPDGSEIAIARNDSFTTGIYVIRADGTGEPRRIVSVGEDRFEAVAWSPDGATLAIQYDYVTAGVHINLYAADGSGARPALLGDRGPFDNDTLDVNPTWSTDSTRIAFTGRPNVTGVFILPGELPPGVAPTSLPVGPDGMWVATVPASRDSDGAGIYRPSPPPNTTLLSTTAANPSFSPNGSRIAFGGAGGTIWTMAADGTDQDNTGVPGGDPSWGP